VVSNLTGHELQNSWTCPLSKSIMWIVLALCKTPTYSTLSLTVIIAFVDQQSTGLASYHFSRQSFLVSTNVTSALEVFLNDMRYINSRFTYLLTYLPCTHNMYGEKSFTAACPHVWNGLPSYLQDVSYRLFKRKLKIVSWFVCALEILVDLLVCVTGWVDSVNVELL